VISGLNKIRKINWRRKMLYGNLEISPEEWLDWKKGFVTQAVFAALTAERNEYANRLVDGETLVHQGRIVAETAKTVGIIYGLDCILVGLDELLRERWAENR
jgi:hypothetical protein